MHTDGISMPKVLYLLSMDAVVLNDNQRRRMSVELEISLLVRISLPDGIVQG